MTADNRIVHGLWIGDSLSPLEWLALRSFIHHGHEFHIWLYSPLKNPMPDGVIPCDANRIIPLKNVFRKKSADPHCGGVGRGSFGSPFSDLFRYKLLHEEGGWWTDMDVTCLKPLDFRESFVFRSHPVLPMIGTVMKAAKGAPFLLEAYRQCAERCNEDTSDWLLPNKILNEAVQRAGLAGFIRREISNDDIWKNTARLLKKRMPLPGSWRFVHWQNEEWRVRGISKNAVPANSVLSDLMRFHGVKADGTLTERIKNRILLCMR